MSPLDFSAIVKGNFLIKKGLSSFIVYDVTFQFGNRVFPFQIRYSKLCTLWETLQASGLSLPELPPKKVFGNMKNAFIIERQKHMEKTLNATLKIEKVLLNPTFWSQTSSERSAQMFAKLSHYIKANKVFDYLHALYCLMESSEAQWIANYQPITSLLTTQLKSFTKQEVISDLRSVDLLSHLLVKNVNLWGNRTRSLEAQHSEAQILECAFELLLVISGKASREYLSGTISLEVATEMKFHGCASKAGEIRITETQHIFNILRSLSEIIIHLSPAHLLSYWRDSTAKESWKDNLLVEDRVREDKASGRNRCGMISCDNYFSPFYPSYLVASLTYYESHNWLDVANIPITIQSLLSHLSSHPLLPLAVKTISAISILRAVVAYQKKIKDENTNRPVRSFTATSNVLSVVPTHDPLATPAGETKSISASPIVQSPACATPSVPSPPSPFLGVNEKLCETSSLHESVVENRKRHSHNLYRLLCRLLVDWSGSNEAESKSRSYTLACVRGFAGGIGEKMDWAVVRNTLFLSPDAGSSISPDWVVEKKKNGAILMEVAKEVRDFVVSKSEFDSFGTLSKPIADMDGDSNERSQSDSVACIQFFICLLLSLTSKPPSPCKEDGKMEYRFDDEIEANTVLSVLYAIGNNDAVQSFARRLVACPIYPVAATSALLYIRIPGKAVSDTLGELDAQPLASNLQSYEMRTFALELGLNLMETVQGDINVSISQFDDIRSMFEAHSKKAVFPSPLDSKLFLSVSTMLDSVVACHEEMLYANDNHGVLVSNFEKQGEMNSASLEYMSSRLGNRGGVKTNWAHEVGLLEGTRKEIEVKQRETDETEDQVRTLEGNLQVANREYSDLKQETEELQSMLEAKKKECLDVEIRVKEAPGKKRELLERERAEREDLNAARDLLESEKKKIDTVKQESEQLETSVAEMESLQETSRRLGDNLVQNLNILAQMVRNFDEKKLRWLQSSESLSVEERETLEREAMRSAVIRFGEEENVEKDTFYREECERLGEIKKDRKKEANERERKEDVSLLHESHQNFLSQEFDVFEKKINHISSQIKQHSAVIRSFRSVNLNFNGDDNERIRDAELDTETETAVSRDLDHPRNHFSGAGTSPVSIDDELVEIKNLVRTQIHEVGDAVSLPNLASLYSASHSIRQWLDKNVAEKINAALYEGKHQLNDVQKILREMYSVQTYLSQEVIRKEREVEALLRDVDTLYDEEKLMALSKLLSDEFETILKDTDHHLDLLSQKKRERDALESSLTHMRKMYNKSMENLQSLMKHFYQTRTHLVQKNAQIWEENNLDERYLECIIQQSAINWQQKMNIQKFQLQFEQQFIKYQGQQKDKIRQLLKTVKESITQLESHFAPESKPQKSKGGNKGEEKKVEKDQ